MTVSWTVWSAAAERSGDAALAFGEGAPPHLTAVCFSQSGVAARRLALPPHSTETRVHRILAERDNPVHGQVALREFSALYFAFRWGGMPDRRGSGPCVLGGSNSRAIRTLNARLTHVNLTSYTCQLH